MPVPNQTKTKMAALQLLSTGEEGTQLWEEAFNNLLELKQNNTNQARLQLMHLIRMAHTAGIKNQDDRGYVVLKSFLDRVPDAFFVSEPVRENREWWYTQIEEHVKICPSTAHMLKKRVQKLLGFFMYQEITWRQTEEVINWLIHWYVNEKNGQATNYFLGHIPDENLAYLRSEMEATPNTWLHKMNTLLLALLDPSFDVNSCSYPPLLLVVDENELNGPLVLETLLWIRPEIQDRRHHHLAYNMTAMEYVLVCGDTSFAQILNRHAPQSLDRFFACENVRPGHKKTALWTWEQLRLREIPAHFFKKHTQQECGMF